MDYSVLCILFPNVERVGIMNRYMPPHHVSVWPFPAQIHTPLVVQKDFNQSNLDNHAQPDQREKPAQQDKGIVKEIDEFKSSEQYRLGYDQGYKDAWDKMYPAVSCSSEAGR